MMAVFAIFLLLPTYLVRFSLFGVPSTLLEVIIWLLVIISAVRRQWGVQSIRTIDTPTIAGVFVLLVLGALSTVISPDLRAALGLYKGFIIDPLLVFFLLRTIDFSRWPELPWRGYNISALVLAGWGLVQWAAAQQASYRAAGPFESPNYLAFYLVPASMYVIYRVLVNGGLQRLLALAELTIIMSAIYVTNSRGGALGVVAGLSVWALWLLLQGGYRRILAVAAVIVGSILTYTALNVSAKRVSTSDDIRRIVWDHSTALIHSHPLLGVGLGGFHSIYSATFERNLDEGHRVARDVSNAHNLYFTLWLNLGLLGLLSILYFVVISVRKAWSLRAEPLVWAGLAALAAILAHGFVDTPVWKNDLFPIFWLAIATPWLVNPKPAHKKASK